MPFIAIICGLKSEATVVRQAVVGDNVRVGISGADAGRAYELARVACQDGAAAVISIGVSGGLDPALKPGDLVVSDDVLADDGVRYESDHLLKGVIRKAVGDRAIFADMFGSDAIIQSADHKAALFYNHATKLVDMESHGAAKAAAEAQAPFIAIRAVADPASRALPPAALGAVAPDGSTRVLKTLLETAKAPGQFPALLKLGSDSEKALKTLRRDLGPIFRGLFLALDL